MKNLNVQINQIDIVIVSITTLGKLERHGGAYMGISQRTGYHTIDRLEDRGAERGNYIYIERERDRQTDRQTDVLSTVTFGVFCWEGNNLKRKRKTRNLFF